MDSTLGEAVLASAPRRERTEHRRQLVSGSSELVGQASWPLLVGRRHDQMLLFEMAQARRQNVGGDARNVGGQFAVAPRSAEQGTNDEQRPAIADLVKGKSKRSVGHRLSLPDVGVRSHL